MHYMVDHHLLSDGAIILAESNDVANLPVENDTFEIIRQKQYGITVVTIYQYNSL